MGRRTDNILTACCQSAMLLFYILAAGDQSDIKTAIPTQVLYMNKIPLVALLYHGSGDDVSISLHKFEVIHGDARKFPAEDSFQFSSDVIFVMITDKIKFSFQQDHVISNRIIFKFSSVPISTSSLGLSKSQTVFGILCIFGGLPFLNLQKLPGAEEDLLVPPELENPAPFSNGIRNTGLPTLILFLQHLNLFDSIFLARL